MMSNPLVSIIIPVYNVESYLDRCVQSVLNQSYKNLEIILVDDGSPDNCPAMCDEWAKKDNRVKVIHKQNGGLSSARNAGIDIMTGEYAFFIDSDDEIVCDAIEILYDACVENSCDMSLGRYVEVVNGAESKAEFTNIVTIYNEEEYWNAFYNYDRVNNYDYSIPMIIACNKLIKSSAFDGVRFSEGRHHEDEFIIHKLLSKCNKSAFVDSKLYFYYQVQTSIMHSKNISNTIDTLDALKGRLDYFIENNMSCANDAKYHCLSILVNAINSHYEKHDENGLHKRFKQEYKRCKDNTYSTTRQKSVCKMIYYLPNLYYLLRKLLK